MPEPTVSPDPDFKAPSPGLPTEFGPDDTIILDTPTYTEQQRGDGVIEASYLRVQRYSTVEVVNTFDLGDGIFVDALPGGRIVGVERISGPVDVAVLVEVLKKVIFRG